MKVLSYSCCSKPVCCYNFHGTEYNFTYMLYINLVILYYSNPYNLHIQNTKKNKRYIQKLAFMWGSSIKMHKYKKKSGKDK